MKFITFLRKILSYPGQRLIEAFTFVGELATLIWDTFRLTPRKTFSFKLLTEQIIRIGVDSLVVALVTSLFTGMVMALQISLVLESMMLGISQFTGSVVSKAMVKELAPLLTALVIAGRIGSAVAAEIGTMMITEQVSALKTLNANPISYIVVPRFWAGVIVLPILSLFADFMGIIGGGIVSAVVFQTNVRTYFERAFFFIEAGDVVGGLIKSAFFGGIIILVACIYGFRTKGGAEGVGRATTSSVVMAFIFILMGDYVLTSILSMFGM